MYLTKKQAIELTASLIDNISYDLKGRHDFMYTLLEDNDWSLVIKSHALIESLITELILSKINETELKPVIERMPLHDDQVSKTRIIKIYALLPDCQLNFIKRLSEIRNNIVHKFDNIDFTFLDYVAKFDNNQKKSWTKLLIWYDLSDDTRNKIQDWPLTNPKFAFWFSVFMFVSLTTLEINQLKSITKLDAEALLTTTKLLTND